MGILRKVGGHFRKLGGHFEEGGRARRKEMCCFTFCTVSNFSNKQRQFWRKSTRHTLEGEISVEI